MKDKWFGLLLGLLAAGEAGLYLQLRINADEMESIGKAVKTMKPEVEELLDKHDEQLIEILKNQKLLLQNG